MNLPARIADRLDGVWVQSSPPATSSDFHACCPAKSLRYVDPEIQFPALHA